MFAVPLMLSRGRSQLRSRVSDGSHPERRQRMEQALVVENLKKSYGKFEALHGISFEVAPGEIFALIGPNGAGKTTALRIVAVSYTHLRAHETRHDLVCRLLLEKKKKDKKTAIKI